MGNYMNPEAAKIQGTPTTKRTADDGHVLVAVCSNGMWDYAVDVSSQSELEHFEGQYKSGLLIRFKLYQVTQNVWEAHKQ